MGVACSGGSTTDLLSCQVPFEQLVDRFEIIIMTPQILVDALKRKTISSVSKFSLMLFDECHHAMKAHPYAVVQTFYLKAKFNSDGEPVHLPQVGRSFCLLVYFGQTWKCNTLFHFWFTSNLSCPEMYVRSVIKLRCN